MSQQRDIGEKAPTVDVSLSNADPEVGCSSTLELIYAQVVDFSDPTLCIKEIE